MLSVQAFDQRRHRRFLALLPSLLRPTAFRATCAAKPPSVRDLLAVARSRRQVLGRDAQARVKRRSLSVSQPRAGVRRPPAFRPAISGATAS